MTITSSNTEYTIRPLEFIPVSYQGETQWLIRDLQQYSPGFVIPPAEAELVNQLQVYADGKRPMTILYQLISANLKTELPAGILEEIFDVLEEYYLLDSPRYQTYMQELIRSFRDAPFRPMALADQAYPADPDACDHLFSTYAAGDDPTDIAKWESWRGSGIVSPHIDYQRGGEVYSAVWQRGAQAVREADLVLLFATDHKGGLGSLTLTQKPYQTPYGILPTDTDLVDKLAATIGEEEAYRLELNHRQEHSVELSAVWLHHVARHNPPPVVPLLIGSFHHFVSSGQHPANDQKFEAVLQTLKTETAGKKVLCVASVDMAHVGPEFGDQYIMDQPRREALTRSDHSLIDAITSGDSGRFYQEIAAVQDKNKVCGFSPTYLMLRYMGDVGGEKIRYQHCPADAQNHSLVSICGILLD